jgi:hypothetical protein
MKKVIFLAAAALTLVGSAAAAQPYGYGYDNSYGYDNGYRDHYQRSAYRDSDRDGIPDVREWNQDRDRDGRPDQYDRHDNRRDRHRRHHVQRSYGYGYSQRGAYQQYRYDGGDYRGW